MKFDAKNIVIIILIILIILSVGFIAVNLLNNDSNSKDSSFLVDDDSASKKDSFSINQTYPEGPTSEAKIDSSAVPSKLIGSNSLGTVEVLGPFGNTDSDVRIAYLIGMHPLESKAQEFLAPEVISKNYDLVVDVHGNNGMIGGTYEQTNFIFATGQDKKSEDVVYKLLSKLDKLVYYFPAQQSSPPYITLPVEQSGTPTINYETYNYGPMSTTYELMNDFVDEVDKLEF